MKTSVSFGSLLGLAFIVLRLCGVIAWPWIWVTCPLWIPVAVFLAVLLVMGLAALLLWMGAS